MQLGNSVSKCITWVGTVTYMAPERIAGGNQGYGLPSDIWSLGITVMECALGRFPYQAQASMQWSRGGGVAALQHTVTLREQPPLHGRPCGHQSREGRVHPRCATCLLFKAMHV